MHLHCKNEDILVLSLLKENVYGSYFFFKGNLDLLFYVFDIYHFKKKSSIDVILETYVEYMLELSLKVVIHKICRKKFNKK